jgi:hypothetical protein
MAMGFYCECLGGGVNGEWLGHLVQIKRAMAPAIDKAEQV